MELIEYIALYLCDQGYSATSALMPPLPDEAVAVYATGVRPKGDDEGSRFQIVVRGLPDKDTALRTAMEIVDILDDFSGITSIDSPYFARVMLESGVASLGVDDNGRAMYSANFRAWIC